MQKFMQKFAAIVFLVILSGCCPDCPDPAEREARRQFRDAVAAIKVLTGDTTYAEFRAQRLALEITFESNRQHLASVTNEFTQLLQTAKACETLIPRALKYPDQPVRPSLYPEEREWWPAMVQLNPDLLAKVDLPYETIKKDPDFSAPRAVRRGLARVAEQCDAIIRSLQ